MTSEEFTIKPSPLAGPVRITVDQQGVTTVQDEKTRRIEFADVQSVYTLNLPSNPNAQRGLSFVAKDGRRFDLVAVHAPRKSRGEDNLRILLSAMAAVLKAYAAARPGAQIHDGLDPRMNRRTMAIVATVALVIVGAAVLEDGQVALHEYIAAAVLLAAVPYIGLTQFNLFKQPPLRPAADMAAEYLAAADRFVSP